ncbi:hypothetical protein LTR84_008416 [Exophiala bonariae]|uniref:Uncharacterized protein n=1 Tax=Exophiala bonariae TaxID=1690606 RepID=A0AAV9N056_9EURO|nr:hypothetical protein LTR84_008416 [Exophiala bonariae]
MPNRAPQALAPLALPAVVDVKGDDSIIDIFDAVVIPTQRDGSQLALGMLQQKVMDKITQRKAATEKRQ